MIRKLLVVVLIGSTFLSRVYQRADMKADMSVEAPEFLPESSPVVCFDAGHNNFHEISSTYEPFAKLLRNDGIHMDEHTAPFTPVSLENTDLLIIANALPVVEGESSAFTREEIEVLVSWVRSGGSLLLIADHEPFGNAAADLAQALGVGMESVWTVDRDRLDPEIDRSTWLRYSHENGGLGDHSIVNGDDEISHILTFTGQSLSFDSTWTPILKLSSQARNYFSREHASKVSEDTSTYFPVPNQAQLIACEFGEGRMVIAGEAAMFTAQEVRIFHKVIRAGFNYEGYDNKELVLGIVRWLLSK